MAATGVPVLVGRAREEREIVARLDQAERGVGGLVLLAGEPGIGKTALAGWAAVEARRRSFDVGWSTCWQTAAVEPLQPWTQLLSRLEQQEIEAPDLTVVMGDPDSNRTEQADRVAAWLHRRSRGPLLVVIDDLHWADAGTVSVLDRVASVLATMPVVVIGAHRPLDPANSSPPVLARSGADLAVAGSVVDLSVSGASWSDRTRGAAAQEGGLQAMGTQPGDGALADGRRRWCAARRRVASVDRVQRR